MYSLDSLIHILDKIEAHDEETIRRYPEVAGMLEISPVHRAVLSIEHSHEGCNPVWAHLRNVIGSKLRGIVLNDIHCFSAADSLGEASFRSLVEMYRDISHVPLLADCLHIALLFSDISKGADYVAEFASIKEIDCSIHNEASAKILRMNQTMQRLEFDEMGSEIVLALIESHGLMGQFLRGEITYHAFEPWRRFLKKYVSVFAEKYTNGDHTKSSALLNTLYRLLNIIDTAGVRDGLMTDNLLERFMAVDLDKIADNIPFSPFDSEIENRISIYSSESSERLSRNVSLAVRIEHLREKRRTSLEDDRAVYDEVSSLNDTFFAWFEKHLSRCQLWYCESAAGDLSVSAQIKWIAAGMYFWEKSDSYRADAMFHVDFSPIAMLLSPFAPAPSAELARSRSNYRKRLMESMMETQSYEDIMNGTAGIYHSELVLCAEGKKGIYSISLELTESEEANALITLLSIYERKSSVAYHSALKLLCDLYGLRKDDFDRLANEAQYLSTMNAAKSDKERMLRWLTSGKIVEVGPGGGVVLELLEKNFPDADIIGIDISEQVIAALEQKKRTQNARWRIIKGDAFELPGLFEENSLDGVVFCSILHEIYSYIETPDGTRFHLESVRDMLRSAFAVLKPGGRILIRDGIMPKHELRLLQFCCEDARNFFDAFCREFKGRTIGYEYIDDNTIRIDSADAMEFMYTYTWGPESFPYEVREQYGVMTYRDYCQHIMEWLGSAAKLIEIPDGEAQYLQSGYVTALRDRLKYMDSERNPVEFPPSNAIIVIEKSI